MTAETCRSQVQSATSICLNEDVDATAAHQFIERWQAFTASCSDPVPNFYVEIGRVLIGKVAVGGACTIDYQCAPVSGKLVYCAFDQDKVTGGICQIEAAAAAGQPCTWTCDAPGACEHHETGAGCYRSEGTYCIEPQSGLTPSCGAGCTMPTPAASGCYPVKAAGEGCTSDDCAAGLACVGPSNGSKLTCAPKLADGERCSYSRDCQSGACLKAGFNDYQCAPQQVDGATCISSSECISNMCISGHCGLTGMCMGLGASLM